MGSEKVFIDPYLFGKTMNIVKSKKNTNPAPPPRAGILRSFLVIKCYKIIKLITCFCVAHSMKNQSWPIIFRIVFFCGGEHSIN